MSAFFESLRLLASLPDEALERPWVWDGRPGDGLIGRDACYRSLEEEQAALAAAPQPPTEAGRAVAIGQREFGRLRGVLAGVSDDQLDQVPGPGEWPLRDVLAHVLLVERRYLAQSEYALRRGDQEPTYTALSIEVSAAERSGGVNEWADRLATSRSESARLAPTPDGALTRPTRWAGLDVDVRFRLYRFAGHLAEHTIHAEKTLERLGPPPTEAQRIVRRISETRGAHQLQTPREVLARLGAGHRRRAEELVGFGGAAE